MLDVVASAPLWSLLGKDRSSQHSSHLPSSPSLAVSARSTSIQQHTSTSSSVNFTTKLRRMAITPRSANYARLEGGLGPSRTGKGTFSRFTWKKTAIGAAVLILVIWLFGPRVSQKSSRPSEETTDEPESGTTHHFPPVTTAIITTTTATHEQTKPPLDSPPPAHPTSFETDPDPSKTVYCTRPFSPSLPLVQYALMIDAGSTGSRIHVYKFNNCGPSPAYEYELFKKVRPGLSDYAGRPLEAAQSLDGLLKEAVRVVPEALRKCTPVAVKATAGLRLLGAAHSAAILEAVEDRLMTKYPFRVHQQGVVIMDGKDEGVYAWLTANYLLDTVGAGARLLDTPDTHTLAVLDLGGASTQIVFEPTFTKPDDTLVEGDHRYELTFGGKTYVLYQHSYLGYGLMEGRKSVHRLVSFMASLRKGARDGTAAGDDEVVGNPCLAKGTKRLVEIDDERTGEKRNVTMSGEDIGSFEACNRVIELVLAKDAICKVKPCSFDGVYQPSLIDTFATGKILLLSYFYDRMHSLLATTNSQPPPHITASTIGNLAQDVCEGQTAWKKRWGSDSDVMIELEGRPEWCLDLTFMHGLLRLGYEVGDRELAIGKQIEGTELGWSLGATLTMIAGDLKCRV